MDINQNKNYVCGVFFKGAYLSLIRKIKGPAGMAGKLNFFGGKIEPNELAIEAMIRECREETGIETKIQDWFPFCTLRGEDWKVVFYRNYFKGNFEDLKSLEEEKLDWYPILDVLNLPNDKIMSNLKWLIPLALDKDDVYAEVWDPSGQ